MMMMNVEIPAGNERPPMELQNPVGNATPLMILQIPIGITTAFGLTTVVFPVGTAVPASAHDGFFTLQDSNSGDFQVQLVQGFNSQSIFNTYLGTTTLHIPEAMPRFSEIHLKFELEASGLTVYAENDSTPATSLLHFDGDVIFPPIDVVNFHYDLYSMRMDRDNNFLCLTSKKYELAEYVKWVTRKLDIVTHKVQRQEVLDWIEVSNGWLELDGTEEEYQEILDKVKRGCNDIFYPLLCPNLFQDSGSECSSESEDSPDSASENEDEDSEEEEVSDLDSDLVVDYLSALLWFCWDSHD